MFKIYIDRLRQENTEKFSFAADPLFLEIEEKELIFDTPVEIKGEASLTCDYLILKFDVVTACKAVCSICNRLSPYEIKLKNIYCNIPLQEIRGAIFDFQALARESILLEIPPFYECRGGQCAERKNIEQFIKKPKEKQTYFPFSNLNI